LDDETALFHFSETHQIRSDRLYIVQLPKMSDAAAVGKSRHIALRRFKQNKKLLRKGKLQALIKNYVDLNHADPIPAN